MYRGSKRPLDLDEPLAGAEELEPGGADVEAGDSQALAVARLEVSTTLATIASCPRVRMLVLLSEPYRVGRLSITIASDRRKPTASITQRSLVNQLLGPFASSCQAIGRLNLLSMAMWQSLIEVGIVPANR